MGNTNFRASAKLFIVMLLAVWLSINIQLARADKAALKVNLTLAHSQPLLVGEPIAVHFFITNTSDTEELLEMKTTGEAWLSASLISSTGTQITAPLYARSQDADHTISDDTCLISPGSTYDDYAVLEPAATLVAPGKYTLSIHVLLPYGYQDGSGNSQPADRLTQDCSLPLVIVPSDVSKFTGVASNLQGELFQVAGSDPRKARMLIQCLFALPEPQSFTRWQALASHTWVQGSIVAEITDQIERFNSDAGADLLFLMLSRSSPASPSRSIFSSAIAMMYENGSIGLKQHIRGLYASYGEPLDATVVIPNHG